MAKLVIESRAFSSQQDELRKAFPGQFVAVHEGRVVDSDPNEFELHRRVAEKYPREAILVRSVDWTEVIEEISTPFEVEDQ